MEIALSTCWNSHRHTDGYAMLEEIRDLGFRSVELSHGIRASLAPGVLDAVADGIVRAETVHNFCPLPAGVLGAAPNLYQPTSRSRREREAWRRLTCRSIDFAVRVGASLVVLHCGSIPGRWRNPARSLDRARRRALRGSGHPDAVYQKTVQLVLSRLQRRSAPARARLLQGLGSVIGYAAERSICLGIENREDLLEFPLDGMIGSLLAELGAAETIGYWHDVGHAQIKEMSGITTQRSLLLQNGDRQFGFHLHDVGTHGRDHVVPGQGVVDWQTIAAFAKADLRYVLELSPTTPSDGVRAGHRFLMEKFGQ